MPAGAGYPLAMGFNPFRSHEKNRVDILLVVGAIVAAVALVLWAILA